MQVRIFRPTKTTMQSGEKNNKKWVMEYLSSPRSRSIEGLMGYTSSKDMMNEVFLEFSSKEEAINFAKAKNYSFEIIEPKQPILIKKSYASNFK